MKAFVVVYLFLSLIVVQAKADIIYFKDGMKTVCQEKAWEEDGQIKCDYDGWVLTYPKDEVRRIIKTNPVKKTAPTEQKRPRLPIVNKDSSTRKSGSPSAGGIAFYNPRRSNKYWTDKNSKHKSYQEAIQTLAEKYNRSPEWIQAHMGESNDLLQIHQNLANPSLTSERVVDRTPTPKSPGIPFYNPRRSYPYWTSSALKHKSYQEAIKTLAQEYGKSSQWIQRHMGNSNDLTQIHENLSKAK